MGNYNQMLKETAKLRVKNARIAGIAFGYSMAIRFIFIGSVFYVGTRLVVELKLNPKDVYQAIFIIFASAMGAGVAVSNVPSAA